MSGDAGEFSAPEFYVDAPDHEPYSGVGGAWPPLVYVDEASVRADERRKCIAEIEALLDGFGENEITDGYEHGFNEGLARALDALREKED